MQPIDGEDVFTFMEQSLPENFREVWEMEGQVDFAYFLEQAGRFRVNAFLQRGFVCMVFRHIKSKIPNLEDLDENTLTQFDNGRMVLYSSAGLRDPVRVRLCRVCSIG